MLLKSIIQKTAQYIHDKNIELIFDTNVEEKLMAFDKEVMKRILLNLISNAIKFGDKKQKIQIDLNSVDDYVFINVKMKEEGFLGINWMLSLNALDKLIILYLENVKDQEWDCI